MRLHVCMCARVRLCETVTVACRSGLAVNVPAIHAEAPTAFPCCGTHPSVILIAISLLGAERDRDREDQADERDNLKGEEQHSTDNP